MQRALKRETRSTARSPRTVCNASAVAQLPCTERYHPDAGPNATLWLPSLRCWYALPSKPFSFKCCRPIVMKYLGRRRNGASCDLTCVHMCSGSGLLCLYLLTRNTSAPTAHQLHNHVNQQHSDGAAIIILGCTLRSLIKMQT